MSFESEKLGGFNIIERNNIQIDLIKRSGQDPAEWIEENAKYFGELIAVPDLGLHELYLRDPKAAEEFIEKKLKNKEERMLH